MIVHVLLIYLTRLGKLIICEALPSILSVIIKGDYYV